MDYQTRTVSTQAAIAETRRLVEEIDQRIVRQQRRIEKVTINREGPLDALRAVLDDMVKARNLMHSQLASLAAEVPESQID